VVVARDRGFYQCSRAPKMAVSVHNDVLPPFRNIKCFSFVNLIYLDKRIYTLKDI
jgi:hypothetical protein